MARKTQQRQERTTIALVGDGQTERIYFADLRDTDRPGGLTIKPDYPRTIGNYKGVLDRAVELVAGYDEVYALIDADKIIQDKQQKAYSESKKAAEALGVIVLENNPCFELWLLLHFVHTGKIFTDCDAVSTELNKTNRIPGYNKSQKFLINARLYKNYKQQLLSKAIGNAELLEKDRATKDEGYPRAQTFVFFKKYFGIDEKGNITIKR
jgi:hypothetical protein